MDDLNGSKIDAEEIQRHFEILQRISKAPRAQSVVRRGILQIWCRFLDTLHFDPDDPDGRQVLVPCGRKPAHWPRRGRPAPPTLAPPTKPSERDGVCGYRRAGNAPGSRISVECRPVEDANFFLRRHDILQFDRFAVR